MRLGCRGGSIMIHLDRGMCNLLASLGLIFVRTFCVKGGVLNGVLGLRKLESLQ